MKDEEINEKIHVEIMGHDCFHDLYEKKSSPIIGAPFKCRKCKKDVWSGNPTYCQNILDAFLVVEKLKDKKIYLSFSSEPIGAVYFWTICNFYELGKFRNPFGKIQDTTLSASMKIVLAALKTLEPNT